MKVVTNGSVTVELSPEEVSQIERALNHYTDDVTDNYDLWEAFERLLPVRQD